MVNNGRNIKAGRAKIGEATGLEMMAAQKAAQEISSKGLLDK
jgi:hypothetical protein